MTLDGNGCFRIHLVNRCLLERCKTHKIVEPISRLYSYKKSVVNCKGTLERNLTAKQMQS